MKKKLVMLTDIGIKHDAEGWDELRKKLDIVVYHDTIAEASDKDEFANAQKQLILERAKDAEIVLTNKVVLKKEHLEALPSLKYVIMASTGTNAVDIGYCHEHGKVCSNVPAYSTNSVAQLVFAHLLNIYTQAEHYAEKNRKGAWCETPDFCYTDSPIHELAGKTLGVYGFGAIGQRVSMIAQAFGMKVIVFTSKERLPEGVAIADYPQLRKAGSLEEFLSESDIVSLHCPLAPNTKRMVNAEFLSKMKSGAILVNTARGALIDEQALKDALDSGKLFAYAADVVYYEPARKDNPIINHPKAFITPHNAWMTEEALERLNKTIIRNINAYLDNGSPEDLV